jgi:hypothetical protein
MTCQCGAVPHLLTENDADEEAIADLTRQAKRQSGPLATLTRARRDQLKAEVSAERAFAKALTKARAQLLETVGAAVQAANPLTLLNLNDEQLLEFILQGGLGLAVDEFIEQQDAIREAAEKAMRAVQPNFGFNQISPQLDSIQATAAASVFDDVIVPDFKRSINESLRDLLVDVPPNIVMSNLEQKLRRSEGRQLTEVKTRISQYGRGITAAAAEAADMSYYLYTGPMDGITRPFCRELINLVVSKAQMKRLNNQQGLSVLTSGGGYNCRHSWSPITLGFIEAADLTKAKGTDITQANRAARR